MSESDWPLASPTPLPQCDYGEWSATRVLIPAIYLLAFIVGTFGNALVLCAYLNCRGRWLWRIRCHNKSEPSYRPSSSSRSITESLIVSLALADLAFVTTLPLWAVYTALDYHWPFGSFLCRASSYLVALNMYASVFSLAGLSVERYCVIKRRNPSKNLAPVRAWYIVGCVWMAASVLALPALLLRTVREVEGHSDWLDDGEHNNNSGPQCLCDMDYSILVSQDLDPESRERAEVIWSALLGLKSTVLGFLLPLIVLLLCYCSLVNFLSRHFRLGPHPDRQRQRKLLRIVIALVLAFFLCWLPFHANKTLSDLVELDILPYSCGFDRWLVAVHPYAICLAYINSCLNPLLYACCDPAFRQRCKCAVKPFWRRRKGERDDAEDRETGTRDELEEDKIVRDTGHRSKTGTEYFKCTI
ncbi:apelin receptor 2 [Pangasianodon hypophthalmus]|uniref:apelin receptor 2 n=1 Tax=Pangasianodon hypophthalmus TaxID=310915 RepID=UPI000F00707B|nr:apelin receptor 2 [Pangasianodon hypophthalmus]